MDPKKLTIEELIDQVAFHATGGIDEIIAEGKIPVVTIYLDELRARLTPTGDIADVMDELLPRARGYIPRELVPGYDVQVTTLRQAFAALQSEIEVLRKPYNELKPSAIKLCLDTLSNKYEPKSRIVGEAFMEYAALQSENAELGQIISYDPSEREQLQTALDEARGVVRELVVDTATPERADDITYPSYDPQHGDHTRCNWCHSFISDDVNCTNPECPAVRARKLVAK